MNKRFVILRPMAGGSVRFTLDDGKTLCLPDEDLRGIYDALWDLSKEHGAVSTAALLMDARRLHPSHRQPINLSAPQSTALRKAMSLLHA